MTRRIQRPLQLQKLLLQPARSSKATMSTKKDRWTVSSSKLKYKNPWISVREDCVIHPNGKPGMFGVVKMNPGVSILPIDDKGNVYLTQEYHYAVERETLETISGGINPGEDKLNAAKRELLEETGLVASKWIDFGVIDPFTTVIHSPNYLFLAQGLTFSKSNPEETEDIKIIQMTVAEAYQMVMKGEITHGASVTLILKLKLQLETKGVIS